jgi:hypothetical protein
LYWGIVPQDSVYIAIPSFQQGGVGGGEEIDGQCNTYTWSQLSSALCWNSVLQNVHRWASFTLNLTVNR